MDKLMFGKNRWTDADVQRAYSFRFTETPAFVQEDDCIGSGVNQAHREGFDNISLLTREKYSAGTRAEITCSFEGLGCPEIIFVGETELCEDGATRYGACFEVVLYKDGVNVWRHFMDEGRKCHWHKRLGVRFPVAQHEKHTLTAEMKENYLTVAVDGMQFTLRVEDMFEKFHVGITVCEGIAKVYDMKVESI